MTIKRKRALTAKQPDTLKAMADLRSLVGIRLAFTEDVSQALEITTGAAYVRLRRLEALGHVKTYLAEGAIYWSLVDA